MGGLAWTLGRGGGRGRGGPRAAPLQESAPRVSHRLPSPPPFLLPPPPLAGILFITFISWIPSDGNSARYIAKPDGCTSAGVLQGTDTPCTYTPEMRRWDYFKKASWACAKLVLSLCCACAELSWAWAPEACPWRGVEARQAPPPSLALRTQPHVAPALPLRRWWLCPTRLPPRASLTLAASPAATCG